MWNLKAKSVNKHRRSELIDTEDRLVLTRWAGAGGWVGGVSSCEVQTVAAEQSRTSKVQHRKWSVILQ